MKVWKIRHKPSGLFLKPTRHSYTTRKTNFSKKGKVYQSKPTLAYYRGGYGDNMLWLYKEGKHIEIPEEEFEIVEYNMGE